jgi:hypothetical protein
MNAHRLEAVMSQDGQLLLSGLPFRAGDAVEVIILAESLFQTRNGKSPESQKNVASLSPVTGISSDQVYLASISNMMEEWGSDADEAAYKDL